MIGINTVPMGLDQNVNAANPTLKRGANEHCAYGAIAQASANCSARAKVRLREVTST